MNSQQTRVLQALRRAQAWCAANPGVIPPPEGPSDAWTPVTRQFNALTETVNTVTTAATTQAVSGSKVTLEVAGELQLRTHLRQELRAVTKVAQALRKTVPGIGSLRMPSPDLKAEALVKAAEVFISQASTYEAVLVEHTLPSDFLDQLRQAMSALKGSIDGRGAARAGQVSATKELAVSLGLGMKFVQILDSAISKALKAEPARLAEWNNCKRVTIKGVVSRDAAVASPFATPLQVVTTPAAPPATSPAESTGAEVKAA